MVNRHVSKNCKRQGSREEGKVNLFFAIAEGMADGSRLARG